MNKHLLLCVCLVLRAGFAFAQYADEGDVQGLHFGLSLEGNGYSQNTSIGIGGGLATDYRFNEFFSLGASVLFFTDIATLMQTASNDVYVFEANGFVRLYFLRFSGFRNYYYTFSRIFHPYIQASVGMYSAWIDDVDFADLSMSAELGVRAFINNWFIELYARLGKPVAVGVGLMAGYHLAN